MTNLRDPIDATELAFARRVRDYTAPAVVPADHAAVARAAAESGGPRRSGGRRPRWLLAGLAAVAGVAAVAVLINTWTGPRVGASPSPSASVATVLACTAGDLRATVGRWEGAAGHRIGTMTLTNAGAVPCVLSGSPWPSLIDRNGGALITGKITSLQPVRLDAGGSVQALVQTGNYCGPTALEPAAVALDFGALGRVVAKPIAGDESSGVPPCMGEGGPTDDITLQPWGAAQG